MLKGWNFKQIIKKEDLDPEWFVREAESLAMELKGRAGTEYALEKLRNLEELKYLFCRYEYGRGNKDQIRSCIVKLTPWIGEMK